jgi:hypothetical protein
MDINFTTSTGLLADVLAFISTFTPSVDLVTDGKITKIKVSLLIPLPGSGIKLSATSGAEIERTALYQMAVNGSPNAFGLDIPAFAAADFASNQVNSILSDVATFDALLTATTNNTVLTDRYGNKFTSIKHARKTFRKHRKALSRA